MVTVDDWVKEALTDDSLVADALIRLRHRPIRPYPAIQIDWIVRQPRSRPASRHIADSSNSNGGVGKKAATARGSPTTPLSWSGATSHSGGGVEETSFSARPLDPARSKVLAGTSETTSAKRSRKKKTLTELKEEESMLLQERRGLKNELATLRRRFENERTKNESLKRMKLDLQSHQTLRTITSSVASEETISDQLQHMESDSVPTPSNFAGESQSLYLDTAPHSSLLNCSSKVQEPESQDIGFLLPDLNMPLDNDSGSKGLCGMS